jgi:hypothetical protein
MGVIVVAAVCVPRRSRRCSRCAGYRAQTSSHRGADASAVPTASDGADHRAGAGPEQAARLARPDCKGPQTQILAAVRSSRIGSTAPETGSDFDRNRSQIGSAVSRGPALALLPRTALEG